jgi:glycosyltransferase involved in cell wall biosynthesis
MINILFWSNYATLTTGGQKSLSYILRDIDRKLYQPILVSQNNGALTELANSLNIPVETVKLPPFRPQNIFRIVSTMLQFLKIIKKYNINIIHSEELLTVLYTAVFRLLLNVKIIWHVRVLWDKPFQKKVSLFLADKLICVSHAVAESFPDSDKIYIAENGINIDEYDPKSTKLISERLPNNTILIGYLNNLAENKGTHILIQSIPYVINNYPAVKYIIAGGGNKDFTDQLIDMSKKLGVYDSIIFWGEEVSRPKELLNRFDIYVLPSFAEGLARSLLEAMSLEKPVICSDISSNSEVVTHNKTGLLYNTNDPKDLADKTIYLLNNMELAKNLGRNARKHIAENYNLGLTMNKIYSVYNTFNFNA